MNLKAANMLFVTFWCLLRKYHTPKINSLTERLLEVRNAIVTHEKTALLTSHM